MNYISALGNQSFYNSNAMLSGRLGQMGRGNHFMGRQSRVMEPSGMNRMTGASSQMEMNPLTGSSGRSGINPQTASGISGMSQPSGNASPVGMPGQQGMTGFSKAAQTEGQTAVQKQPDLDTYECQTCENRKYQDGSNDPGVSFKTPTHVSPEAAPSAIRAHEMEHVAHERLKAEKEDQEIVSQSVTYHTSVCPECGRVYMAGGTTRTTFRSAPVTEQPPVEKGQYVDLLA